MNDNSIFPAMNYVCALCKCVQSAALRPTDCPNCFATVDETHFHTEQAILVAAQNDAFRAAIATLSGQAHFEGQPISGRVVMTASLAELGPDFMDLVRQAVSAANAFNDDSDPYGEHDFGVVSIKTEAAPQRVYWKIDLFDTDYTFGSENPTNLEQTCRVLTMMLPADY